jgi:hypothetical protein
MASSNALKTRKAGFLSAVFFLFIKVEELIAEEFPQHGIKQGYGLPQLPCISCNAIII